MPTPTTRAGVLTALSALLVVLAVGAGAEPASAHETLVSSTPAEGEQLTAPPEQITLVFSDSVLTMGAEVVLNDASGRNWVDGDVAINGATVTATVAPGMPAGAYDIIWKVVSGDGHPISALVPFSVLQAAPTAAPTAVPTSTPTAAQTAAPVAPTERPDSGDGEGDPWPIGPVILSAIAVVAALGLVILLVVRRRGAGGRGADTDADSL
ncbi:Copper resistance protein C precursor [Microbacterium hydrocarbonoxydans]|uniref:Copper resistance protein C n=1 Tax=Microbacterium hydrocarbonoxydans TaxID=273678 RepID=A0A0M2HR58_9MICO|nr:copper resistance CopC family protein [Microbacterium hydrocarbonoxydans]KJL47405.1 Copper resistance protein C precursor [Microbacterium hydrocarbonoxydans]